jgi:predicted nucleic acid-binding protein
LRYVLDCSVAVRWFVPQTYWETAALVLDRLSTGEILAIAPDVIVPEFGHVLRKLVVGGKLDAAHGRTHLQRFLSLPIDVRDCRPLAESAYNMALKHSATFYDALYVALAESHGVQVLTGDDRMEAAFRSLDLVLPLSRLA